MLARVSKLPHIFSVVETENSPAKVPCLHMTRRCQAAEIILSRFISGYTTQTHGSHQGGTIDAIQLETPRHLRSKDVAPQYARDVAWALNQYLQLHYDTDSRPPGRL